VDYATAVDQAPPGWRHFTLRDVDRLPDAVRRHELARVPPHDLTLVERGDAAAAERVVRALFWTLVYHLEAERWDELARHEPIHPDLLDVLPEDLELAVDVGAGGGRLTQHLCTRAGRVVAIEPSIPLGLILLRRLPGVCVVSAWAEHLPLPGHRSQLTAACGAFGPDPRVLAELYRVTAVGGTIALVNPEQPEWFEDNGWARTMVTPPPAPPHPSWIDEFFGPPEPPRELVMLRVR
jgi:SAM-dependent methyltransferase